MADAIVVLNAGSSSLKFSVFVEKDEDCKLLLLLRGQIEELLGTPRFVACDGHGNKIAQHECEHEARLGHNGAIRYLFDWGRSGQLAEHQVKAIDGPARLGCALVGATCILRIRSARRIRHFERHARTPGK